MKKINIHEAKTHLSRIIDRVAHGESVLIAKAGKPMAILSSKSAAIRIFPFNADHVLGCGD